MLQDRGYALPPEDSEDFTYESFLQRWNGKVHKDLTILGGCSHLHAGSRLVFATGAWAADASTVPASKMDDDDKRIGVFFPVSLETCVPPLHLPIAHACNTKCGQPSPGGGGSGGGGGGLRDHRSRSHVSRAFARRL